MKRDKYRKAWLRAHKGYERRAYGLLRRYFKSEAMKVPYAFLDKDNYKQTINNSVNIGGLYNTYFDIYKLIGLVHGERIGKGINRDAKNFNNITFQSEYTRNLYNWVLENIGYRIVSVRAEFIKYIQQLVADSFRDGLTPQQLASQIHKLIGRRDFYRWQALRIARTESGLAANRATLQAGRSSGFAMVKEWISIPDERTRPKPGTITKFNHRVMDGVTVDEDDYFNVQGEFIKYPNAAITKTGAKSSGGNVINCRCTTALLIKRDSNGRAIRR